MVYEEEGYLSFKLCTDLLVNNVPDLELLGLPHFVGHPNTTPRTERFPVISSIKGSERSRGIICIMT